MYIFKYNLTKKNDEQSNWVKWFDPPGNQPNIRAFTSECEVDISNITLQNCHNVGGRLLRSTSHRRNASGNKWSKIYVGSTKTFNVCIEEYK